MTDKITRGKWVFRDGKFIPFNDKPKQVDAPFVKVDEVAPFINHVRNTVETSMSTYRKHLKEDGYFEKGNDRMHYELPSREKRAAEIREAAMEAERQVKWGMGKSTSEERELWEQEQRQIARKA